MLEQSSTVQHLLRRGRNEGLAHRLLAGARYHVSGNRHLTVGIAVAGRSKLG
ncbi:MAG: hypothetical protein ACOVP2_05010 [Armatimonadaceae bacterium]